MKALLLTAALLIQAAGQLPNQTGSVTGRLTKNGQPAANIRVGAMVIPEAGVSVAEASSLASVVLTDADGRYRLENIPPGRYYVTAGFVDTPTYFPGVSAIGSAKAVVVEAGVTTEGIDFTTAVSAGATVSGRVIYPPGQSVPINQKVTLVGAVRMAAALESVLKADGSFEIQRVRPGTYTLRVPPWTATVIVGDEDVPGVDIEVPYNVAGTVTVENNGPLPNLSLSLVSAKPRAEPQKLALSAAGAFSSQLTPGEYRLGVSGVPDGYAIKTISSGPVDLVANPLTVVAGTPPAAISVLLAVASPPPWVTVSGKVSGPGFEPGTPYSMTLTGKGLLVPIQSRTSPDGSFEVARVLPGDYTLGVSTRKVGVHVGKVDLKNVELALPRMKEVAAGVTIQGPQQQITMSGTTANGGLVFRVAGPANALELLLTDDAGTTSATATRQPDGTFLMRLPEGDRIVKVEAPGYTLKSLSYGTTDLLANPTLRVASADTARVEMTLEASPKSFDDTLVSGLSATLNSALNSIRVLVANAAAGVGAGNVIYTIAGGAVTPPNAIVYVGPDVAQANVSSSVPPVAAAVGDSIVLRAEIDKQGTVTDVTMVRGDPQLNAAAIAAVKQWRYRPYLLNGLPTAVITTIRLDR